jgi:6,7-dimethyl-8-ribityllumazine synthase
MSESMGSADVRVAIIAARFNAEIVDRLIETAAAELEEAGVPAAAIQLHRVPGAFELPLAAQALLRASDPPDAVICLGAVVRGETPHFDFVAGGAAEGIMQVGLDTGRPVIFGVLTTNTMEQAWDRADGTYRRGADSARDALEMIQLLRSLQPTR